MATYVDEIRWYIEDGLWDIHTIFEIDMLKDLPFTHNASLFPNEVNPEIVDLAKKQEKEGKEWIGDLKFRVGISEN